MEKAKPTTPEPKASRTWERLEEFVRQHVQRFIQAPLEERSYSRQYMPVRSMSMECNGP